MVYHRDTSFEMHSSTVNALCEEGRWDMGRGLAGGCVWLALTLSTGRTATPLPPRTWRGPSPRIQRPWAGGSWRPAGSRASWGWGQPTRRSRPGSRPAGTLRCPRGWPSAGSSPPHLAREHLPLYLCLCLRLSPSLSVCLCLTPSPSSLCLSLLFSLLSLSLSILLSLSVSLLSDS